MALDIYFREDIANILRSVNMANGSALFFVDVELKVSREGRLQCDAEAIEHIAVYREGFDAALGAVAAAFGILPEIGP